MVDEDVIDKIKSRGYWRVNIRPLKYEKNAVVSLSDLRDIIHNCKVRYRGWPYPLVKDEEINSGENFILGGVNWQDHIEYWKIYQSLQFLHYFAMREDWEDRVDNFFGGKIKNPRKPGSGLSIIGTLYSVTEIFEFTLRLIQNHPYEFGMKINIGLYGTMNRKLFFYDKSRMLDGDYTAKIPEIIYEKEFSLEEFMSNSQQFALDCCVHIFERFNWTNVPRNLLESEQKKFLGKTW